MSERTRGEITNKSDGHNSDAVRHLYVHFPFCARICPYCAFYKTRGSAAELAGFCDALALEADRQRFPLALETIFFGGGTPTAQTTAQLIGLLQKLRDTFDLSLVREWTIEANPGSVSAKKAAALIAGGIDRVSLGVQSWDDALLRLLGREHNAAQAEESFRIFRDAGFSNISIDLMFALPGQTETQWRQSLEKSIALQPEHISTYCLTYEEDTDFLARFERGEFRQHDEIDARFLEIAMAMLQEAGYEHYEISNYARPGFPSLHNQAYWHGADYLGLGPSAFSTRGNARWQNVADHREYARRLTLGQSPVANVETLTDTMKRTERIALGLRTRDGITDDTICGERVSALADAGLLQRNAHRLILTTAGKLVADSVAAELL
ncbi:MAG: radical SAM family heme chaperone HemW [Verrucomicrobiota bacterium]|nr:radical SAM family heme chaperone HemW [Verrucomicrobiota bacterium]